MTRTETLSGKSDVTAHKSILATLVQSGRNGEDATC